MAANQSWRRPQEVARLGQHREWAGSPASDSPPLEQKDGIVAIEASPSFHVDAGDPHFTRGSFLEDGSHCTGVKNQLSLTSEVIL